jgi:glycosyltransferase involved in cell wall biosynthesis
MSLRILAMVCVRNEQIHIRRCLSDLIRDGIDVALLDNGSTDATLSIAREFLGRGLVFIRHLPWTGALSMRAILEAKAEIAAATGYDWFIHADADEWFCSPWPEADLAAAVARVDHDGFNCINFTELTFVPVGDEDFEAEGYSARMTTYYFYQPRYPRLMRAWKAGEGLSNVDSGGHLITGREICLCPTDFYMRHYIVLSEGHAKRKYLNRNFAEEELARGWHADRVSIAPEKLRVPPAPVLRSLPHAASMEFDLSRPVAKHFWLW